MSNISYFDNSLSNRPGKLKILCIIIYKAQVTKKFLNCKKAMQDIHYQIQPMKMGVQNCGTHIFPYTILVITIFGKHFPQTRRSLDRDQMKACLPNKN